MDSLSGLAVAHLVLVRPRMRLSCLLLLGVVLTCTRVAGDEKPRPIEGVYHLHNGYQSETLELRNGRFRYWFWSDAGGGNGRLPIEGTYSVDGATVTLNGHILLGNQRVFHTLKGLDALWQPDILEAWLTKGAFSSYGVIVKVRHPPKDLSDSCLPMAEEVCTALREATLEGLTRR
jgi:hypothetical protein